MPVSNNITMRIDPETLKRIDQAARMSGKSRTQFMIDEALHKADSLLPDPDCLHIQLTDPNFQTVLALLEKQPDEQAISRLMARQGLPWNNS